ncbi:hypothetical protein EJB05_00132, partial [Eragrostis curvula]
MVSDTARSLLNPFAAPPASADMERNPVFSPSASSAGIDFDNTSASSGDGTKHGIGHTAAMLPTVNIRAHVPVTLEIADPNYSEWRMFFDSVLGKFGITSHVVAATPLIDRDDDWKRIDSCILNCITLHYVCYVHFSFL